METNLSAKKMIQNIFASCAIVSQKWCIETKNKHNSMNMSTGRYVRPGFCNTVSYIRGCPCFPELANWFQSYLYKIWSLAPIQLFQGRSKDHTECLKKMRQFFMFCPKIFFWLKMKINGPKMVPIVIFARWIRIFHFELQGVPQLSPIIACFA